jgi:hypothetical protein
LLGSTVNCAGWATAVTGTEATENTMNIANATRIKNGRNKDAWPSDRAARHEITPANPQIDHLPNKETNFVAAICDIAFTPDACPEPTSGSRGRQTACIPDNGLLTHHPPLAPFDGLML